jgi:hypothetical protein
VGTETVKDKSSTGRVWSVGIHHVTAAFSLGARFEIHEPFISLSFPNFGGRGKPRVTETADTESAHTGHDCSVVYNTLKRVSNARYIFPLQAINAYGRVKM